MVVVSRIWVAENLKHGAKGFLLRVVVSQPSALKGEEGHFRSNMSSALEGAKASQRDQLGDLKVSR